MDSGPSTIVSIITIIIVLLLAILFTLTEYSLIKVRPSALKDLQNDKDKINKNINNALYMLEHLTEYLSTAQVGITVTSLILGWIGEETITNFLINSKLIPIKIDNTVASIIAILLFTFIHAVFTDLVPKNIAIDEPIKVLLFIVRPIRFFHIILYPLIWLFDRVAALFTKILGYNIHPDEDIYSQNEIISLSEDAAQAGELDADDLTFMKRAFSMNDKIAVDIMIDRTQLTVLDITSTIQDALNIYLEEGFSRIPVVANNDKDKILGYVYNYDLVRQGRLDLDAPVRLILRNIPTINENQKITKILREMITHRTPIVVVKDEYGGTSGIVTDKDIYEELFGTVRDEIDDVADDLIVKMRSDENGKMHYKISGKVTLYDFERYFKIKVDKFEESEMVTLSGYILDSYPNINIDKTVIIDEFEITALDYKDAYINDFEVIKIKNKGI